MNNCGPSQPTIDRAERNRKDREKYARNVAQRESRNLRRRRALDASAKEKEKRLSDARGANHSNAIPGTYNILNFHTYITHISFIYFIIFIL